jgi:hypothetical protein
MKVKISKYPTHLGPYQLAEALCFWVKEVPGEYGIKEKPEWVYNFGRFLSEGTFKKEDKDVIDWNTDNTKYTWLTKFLNWINGFRKQTIQVRIDGHDVWNMDSTLAHIILPMLEKLQAQKHGAPNVDDEDVPVGLKSTSAAPKENEWDTDDNHFKRWDYVMNEMIFAFKLKLNNDWEDECRTGEHHILWVKEEGSGNYRMEKGENDTHVFDIERFKRITDRQQNGFRLFGKYYNSLWS